MTTTFCQHCYGTHEPDDDKIYVEWKGKRYFKPFHCMCCGKETCARQFAYGRTCGVCDTGLCQTNPHYYHPSYKKETVYATGEDFLKATDEAITKNEATQP